MGADDLYGLFIDWLQNRPSGLLKIEFRVPEKDPLYVVVSNYTLPWSRDTPRIVYSGWSAGSPIHLAFKVYRIPKRYEVVNETVRTRFFDHYYVFYVRARDKIYLVDDLVEPKDPITNVVFTASSPLKAEPLSEAGEAEQYLMGTSYNFQNVKIGEIHSINGISVSWGFTSEDRYRKIRIEQYQRYASITGDEYLMYKRGEYDLNNLPWGPMGYAGKVPVEISCIGFTSSASGGACRYIVGRVRYRYDLYCIEYPLDITADFILLMVPQELTGYWASRETLTCSICGSKTPSDYAGIIEAGNQQGDIVLGSGSGATVWSTSLGFTIGITLSAPAQYEGSKVTVRLSFTYKVSSSNVYYEARPKLHVVKDSSRVGDDLYYWYKYYANVKDVIVHFFWTSP